MPKVSPDVLNQSREMELVAVSVAILELIVPTLKPDKAFDGISLILIGRMPFGQML